MLNKNDVVPLYKQLQEELRKQIQSGERKPREKIPSEIDLAEHYQVSVITARKAVSELALEGLVEKKLLLLHKNISAICSRSSAFLKLAA